MSENNVYVIENSSGTDKCPDGKLALYTNVEYNQAETGNILGNILIMSPNIQLNKSQLEGYGFIVGGHDGVSSVVNNMAQEATLVAGDNLDGEKLTVAIGATIPSLVKCPLNGGTWNDAVQSVVSASTTSVNITMTLQNNITLSAGETYYAELEIVNNSTTAVPSASIDATSGDETIMSIGQSSLPVDIPASGSAKLEIPLVGESEGSVSLTCVLNIPIGIINGGVNDVATTVTITQPKTLKVKQTYVTNWEDTWPSTDYIYSYTLVLSSTDKQVNAWQLSFLVPDDAYLSSTYLASMSSWFTCDNPNPTDGYIYLESVAGKIISPNNDIDLALQIVYPEKADDHQTIEDLTLTQLS